MGTREAVAVDEREGLMIERAKLADLLKAREGKMGYSANVEALKARLAEIDAILGEPVDG